MTGADREENKLLSELDLAMIHALQIDARASWTAIGEVLGVDASTIARRWAQLVEAGLAWLTVWPTPQRWTDSVEAAIVYLTIDTAHRTDVVRALSDLRWVPSVDETADGLVALAVGAVALNSLHDRIVGSLSSLTGVRGVTIEYAAAVHSEDSNWRLRVLSEKQRRALQLPGSTTSTRLPRDATVDKVVALLQQDVRMPLKRLADELGVSAVTARRMVERLVRTGLLRFGCDFAMPAAGFDRGVIIRARSDDPAATATAALPLHNVHRSLSVVSSAPVVVFSRMRSFTELAGLEREWDPRLDVVDRIAIVRTIKRNGHLLDDRGRSVGLVESGW